MKLEDQVCSLDLAKRLKELGVKQSSLFYHLVGGVCSGSECLPLLGDNWCSAFTVAELGALLPWDITISRNIDKEWHIHFAGHGLPFIVAEYSSIMSRKNEADSRAEMLLHLIEYKLIEVNK